MKRQIKQILILVSTTVVTGVLGMATTLANEYRCEDTLVSHDTELSLVGSLKLSANNVDPINQLLDMGVDNDREIYRQKLIPPIKQHNITIAQAENDIQKKPLGWSTLDFSTPPSPAAKIIGYSGDIGGIATPNQLAVKLLNGLDSDGSFQTGFAIDISPYLMARGTGFTLEEYKDSSSGFKRFLANTKISIATSKSDSTARLGFGAEFILLNEGDFRFDSQLLTDFQEITKDLPPFDPADPEYKVYNNSLKPKIKAAKDRALARNNQKQIWTLGVGTSLISTTK
jgi:hypothetical protein